MVAGAFSGPEVRRGHDQGRVSFIRLPPPCSAASPAPSTRRAQDGAPGCPRCRALAVTDKSHSHGFSCPSLILGRRGGWECGSRALYDFQARSCAFFPQPAWYVSLPKAGYSAATVSPDPPAQLCRGVENYLLWWFRPMHQLADRKLEQLRDVDDGPEGGALASRAPPARCSSGDNRARGEIVLLSWSTAMLPSDCKEKGNYILDTQGK